MLSTGYPQPTFQLIRCGVFVRCILKQQAQGCCRYVKGDKCDRTKKLAFNYLVIHLNMKSAQAASTKYVERAGQASADYVQGAEGTQRDQAAAAIAAKANYAAGVTAAITRGAYEKGLQASGKAGWLEGVRRKGQNRFAEGVAAGQLKYATNSGKYDAARGAADALPRGPKGSEANYARAKAVGQALRKTKVGA